MPNFCEATFFLALEPIISGFSFQAENLALVVKRDALS
jgi:hypothetical protein